MDACKQALCLYFFDPMSAISGEGTGPTDYDLPVDFPSVERLRVEDHRGGVASLSTVDADFSSELHPGDGEDGAGVGTRQGEHILLPVFQEPQHPSRERGGSIRQENSINEQLARKTAPTKSQQALP